MLKTKKSPKFQKALLGVLKAISGRSAQTVYYGTALLAIATMGGMGLPPELMPFVSSIGGNLVAGILDRIVKGEQIPVDEICDTIEKAIADSQIKNLSEVYLIERQIAHLFHELDLLNYAVSKGDMKILEKLNYGFSECGYKFQELIKQIQQLNTIVVDIYDQNNEILEGHKKIIKSLDKINPLVISNNYSSELVDEKIISDTKILQKARFFAEFNRFEFSLTLADRITDGMYSNGTDKVKSWALAWCSRLLVNTNDLTKAEEYLDLAKRIGKNDEIQIARAFILSNKNDNKSSIEILSKLNTHASHTAMLMIITNSEGKDEGIKWFNKSELCFDDLDPDGKFFLIETLLGLGYWQEAQLHILDIHDQDYLETPILNHMVGLLHILNAIPLELRSNVIQLPPYELLNVPLSSDNLGIESQRQAYLYFNIAKEAALELGCLSTAAVFDEYKLWLELIDPKSRDKGIERLKKKLENTKTILRLVPYALHFGIKLDISMIEQRIDQEIAINGETTPDAKIARYALAFTKESFEEIVNYLDRYNDELEDYLNEKQVIILKIRLLINGGFGKKAYEYLEKLKVIGLSNDEEKEILALIVESEGDSSIHSLKTRYINTNKLVDLDHLVSILEQKKEWVELSKFSRILFNRTHNLQEAERYVNALSKINKNDQLIKFLKNKTEFLNQSENLQIQYFWSLFIVGKLTESRTEITKISPKWDDRNFRTLMVNLAISSGKWHSLHEIIIQSEKLINDFSPQDLLIMAQLAQQINYSNFKNFLIKATANSDAEAQIFTAAYFLACQSGIEDDPEVSSWLIKASELSGNDGPIKRFSLKDIIDKNPEWDRQRKKLNNTLRSAEMPMVLYGKATNQSLMKQMLFPAIRNKLERDPRRRGIIPAFSGNRQQVLLTGQKTIGLEASSLVTLGYLSILEKIIDTYDTVYIPHSTLSWLFEEKINADFHQPSQLKHAHKISNLFTRGILEKFIPSTIPDSDLSNLVGFELSSLISEAIKVRENDNHQYLVVQPSPVFRISSYMEEEADLTKYSSVLCSCQSLIKKLRQNGEISEDEETKSLAYLKINENLWPEQPEIQDGANLFLDQLATNYLSNIGMLEKLNKSGFKLILSLNTFLEAQELILYENNSEEILRNIEYLRSVLANGIDSGKIKVGARHDISKQEARSNTDLPTLDLFTMIRDCEMIISDDRFFNQNPIIEYKKEKRMVFSSLDLVDNLTKSEIITPMEQYKYKTILRRAGFILVPFDEKELSLFLNSTFIHDSKVIETHELKVIREYFLLIRMSNWFNLSKDVLWLDKSIMVFIKVLKKLWKESSDILLIRARANWIIDQLDFRGWAHIFNTKDSSIDIGYSTYIINILTPPEDLEETISDEYRSWANEKILIPIKEHSPKLYGWITDWYIGMVREWVKVDLTKEISDE